MMSSETATCPRCNGNKVLRMKMLPAGEYINVPCNSCGATGEIEKPEKMQTRLELIVKSLYQLELLLGNDLPVVSLLDTNLASGYVKSGASNSRFFLVCNQEEMVKIISTELTKYREKQKTNGL